jgi:hypothetical protein
MAHGDLSQKIRDRAVQRYVQPAKLKRQRRFTLAIRELMTELEAEGFPKNHPRQFCTAVQAKKFLNEYGLEIEHVDAPPQGHGPNVVVHYLVKSESQEVTSPVAMETPSERAKRVTDKLAGRLKDVIASFGGTEGYMRWVRGEDEE